MTSDRNEIDASVLRQSKPPYLSAVITFLLCFSSAGVYSKTQDTLYVPVREHINNLKREIAEIKLKERPALVGRGVVRKLISGIDTITITARPAEFNDPGKLFSDKAFESFSKNLNSYLASRDTLSPLLDSVYFYAAFGWFADRASTYHEDQRMLASYYFLSNKVRNLLKALDEKIDSVTVLDKDRVRLKTEFQVVLSQLNAKLQQSSLLKARPANSVVDPEAFSKLLHHLQGITRMDKDLSDHLDGFAAQYEHLWNKRFLDVMQNMRTLNILPPEQRNDVAVYYDSLKSKLRPDAGAVKKNAEYLLTFNWTNLLAAVHKIARTAIPEVLSPSTLKQFVLAEHVRKGRDTFATFDVYQITWLARTAGADRKLSAFVQRLEQAEAELSKRLLALQEEAMLLPACVENVGAGFHFEIPFDLRVSVLPHNGKVTKARISVYYIFPGRDTIDTGIRFDDITFDYHSVNSLGESFTKLLEDGTPYTLDAAKFKAFVERLGFREEYLTLPTVSLSSAIEFTYLGQKVSWDLTAANDLTYFQNKRDQFLTDATVQIKAVLVERVREEIAKLISASVLETNRFIKENIQVILTDLKPSDILVTSISSKSVTVKSFLQRFSPLLDSSSVELTFNKTGDVSKPRFTISEKVYENILRSYFPFVVGKTRSGDEFTLALPNGQKVGQVAFNANTITFAAAEGVAFRIEPDWQLKPGTLHLDLQKRALVFQKATLSETVAYSRFGVLPELDGAISFAGNKFSISLSAASTTAVSKYLISKLEEWKTIPDGFKAASVSIRDNRLVINYANMEYIRDRIDLSTLEELSGIGTVFQQAKAYEEKVAAIYRSTREKILGDFNALTRELNRTSVDAFIARYRDGVVLKFTENVTASIEVNSGSTLVLGIHTKQISCQGPLFHVELTNGNAPRYFDANTACLAEYVRKLIPQAVTLADVKFYPEDLALHAKFEATFGDIKGSVGLTIGMDGKLVIDDKLLSEKELLKEMAKNLPPELKNNLDALRDSLNNQIKILESALRARFGGNMISGINVLARGGLPYGLSFNLSYRDYNLTAFDIHYALDGVLDFTHCKLDLEKIRALLNSQLNAELVSIEELTPVFGKNSFKLRANVRVHEKKFLNLYANVSTEIDLTRGNFSIDLNDLVAQLTLQTLLLDEVIFRRGEVLTLDYDDLKFSFFKSETKLSTDKRTIGLSGKAIVRTERPQILIPFTLTLPLNPAEAHLYNLRFEANAKALFDNVFANGLSELVPPDWKKLGFVRFDNPRLIYNSRNIPSGLALSLFLDLKGLDLGLLNGAMISLPDMMITQKGVSFTAMDRFIITVPVNCPVPPVFIFTSATGEFSKKDIVISGRMTIAPPDMENVILLEGKFMYEFAKPLALRSKDDVRVFRIISLGTQESLFDLQNGIIRRSIEIGGPFKDVIYVKFEGEINAKKFSVRGEGNVRLFGADVFYALVVIDLGNRIITAKGDFDFLAVKFGGEFSSGRNFISPTFAGTAELKILGIKLAGTELSLQPDWAEVGVSVFGIKTGVTAPSYRQITPARIADLILALLTPDLDVEEAFKQILKGNLKINPFSDFGDAGSGGGGGSDGGGSGGEGGGGGDRGTHGGSGMRGNFANGNESVKQAMTDALDGSDQGGGPTPTGPGTEPGSGTQPKPVETSKYPDAIGVPWGDKPSGVHVRDTGGGKYWIYDEDQAIAEIPDAFKPALLNGGKLRGGVKLIQTTINAAYFVSGDVIYAFGASASCKRRDSSGKITAATIGEKLKDGTLRGNLIAYLEDCLLRDNGEDSFSVYDNAMIYVVQNKTIRYYYMGRKTIVNNSANVPADLVLKAELKK